MAPPSPSTKKNATSSIAMALAGQSASLGIPKPHNGPGDIADEGNDAAKTKDKHGMLLPTPPNSMSPSLHPNTAKGREVSIPPTPPANGSESDIDLQDAMEHEAAQSLPTLGKGRMRTFDAAGAITPTLLATHHLPSILLTNGPLAIRHIMGHLTTTVPGFAGIPSTKARRLVVGALEGRGGASGEATGGVNGDVVFEKVGWGKWDAHKQGEPSRQPPRQVSPLALRPHGNHGDDGASAKAQSPGPRTMRIPHRPRLHHRGRMASSNSMARSHQSPHPIPFAEENEADGMSLDESSDHSSEPIDYTAELEDEGDETDEEDWASMGAAALRANSLPKHPSRKPAKRIDYNAREIRRPAHARPLARSAPYPPISALEKHKREQEKAWERLKQEETLEGVNADDAEAVRALMQLGSH